MAVGVNVVLDGVGSMVMLRCGGDPASEHWPATAESIAETINWSGWAGPSEFFAE